MNNFIKALLSASLAIVLLGSSVEQALGCDRSGYALDSITFNGSEYSIYTTFCIGGGVVGSTFGADNFTATFAIGLYGSPTLQMTSFSPPFVISDTTNCLANAFTFSGGAGMNVDTGIAYVPSCFYTCISSTVGCGRPHSDCNQSVITVNELPDSLRLFGIEGTGNPIAGCFPNPEMLIDFNTLPVIWSSFGAVKQDEIVEIDWSTSQESNNNYFRVMRAAATGDWEELGTVNAVGHSETRQSYSFNDYAPQKGINRYKVVQVDNDGRTSETEVVSLQFELDEQFAWKHVGPVPTVDQLTMSFVSSSAQPVQLAIFNLRGQKVFEKSIDGIYGLNRLSIDISAFEAGAYYLKLNCSTGTLTKKIVKI